MAESMTETHSGATSGGDVRKIVLDWVSASGGTVTQSTSTKINGQILRVVFNPGATAPTAAYDMTILDESGMDILAGQGADLSETNTTNVCPGVPLKDGTTTSVVPMVINDTLTLTITNAGDSKTGSVTLYLR